MKQAVLTLIAILTAAWCFRLALELLDWKIRQHHTDAMPDKWWRH